MDATTSAKSKSAQKKQNRGNTRRIIRDEAALEAIDAALDELLARHKSMAMTDRRIIEDKIREIRELKDAGIPYKAIYELFRNSIGMRISFNTFVLYVGEAARKMRSATTEQKPEQQAEKSAQTTHKKPRKKGGMRVVKVSIQKHKKSELLKVVRILNSGKEVQVVPVEPPKFDFNSGGFII